MCVCGARARVSNVLFVSVHNILLHFCSRILPLLSPTLLLLLAFLAFLPLARVRVFFISFSLSSVATATTTAATRRRTGVTVPAARLGGGSPVGRATTTTTTTTTSSPGQPRQVCSRTRQSDPSALAVMPARRHSTPSSSSSSTDRSSVVRA